jgi:hypothetical protein
MPVDLVSIYEEEFYRYYESDVVYFPLKSNLDFKDNSLDIEVVSFIIWYFTTFFIEFAISNYGFKFE